MEDYLSKQEEFKLWLTEEKHKDMQDIKSPKAKVYFKAFVKLWNKRKLPQKYYRGTVSCETPPNQQGPGRQRFSFVPALDESPFPNSVSFPQTIDLSHEGSLLSDSPFSTFGKSPGTPTLPVVKTPGIGHDLLDLKRKAIFNNMGKDTLDHSRASDTSNTSNPSSYNSTSDHSSARKSGSSGSGSTSTDSSASSSNSPKSSKSSRSKKEREENLYKVTVLSWTSKGELQVLPSSASPNLPNNEESSVDPDILAKHITNCDYSSIDEHNLSIPYKEVDDAIMDTDDPTYCLVEPRDPTYASPYKAHQNSPKLEETGGLSNENKAITASLEDLYAVPIKKKKSSDQSETVSLTSNESTALLDRKYSNNGHAEMDKLSDIVSSGSDFSLTSGSSNESLNQHLLLPGQDGPGKASSAPELSTISEGDVTKGDITNVTNINMTTFNNSYLETGNISKTTYVDMNQWKKNVQTPGQNRNETLMNTTENIVDIRMEQVCGNTKMADFSVAASSTPDPSTRLRKHNILTKHQVMSPLAATDKHHRILDPSRHDISKMGEVAFDSIVPKRTASEPIPESQQDSCDKGKRIPRKSLPTPPPPPPRNLRHRKDFQRVNKALNSPIVAIDNITNECDTPKAVSTAKESFGKFSVTPEITITSPRSDSWPTPPPGLDQTPGSGLQDVRTPGSDTWPTPPTPYDFVQDYSNANELTPDPCLLWPTPQLLSQEDPYEYAATPDSVFETSKTWPTPPSPLETTAANPVPSIHKVDSDDEVPNLVPADFVSNKSSESSQNERTKIQEKEAITKPPVLNLTSSNKSSFIVSSSLEHKANAKIPETIYNTQVLSSTRNNENLTKTAAENPSYKTNGLTDNLNQDNCQNNPVDSATASDKRKLLHQNKENQNKDLNEQKYLAERKVSTTSIERYETDIDTIVDSPQQTVETETKKRLVLETVV